MQYRPLVFTKLFNYLPGAKSIQGGHVGDSKKYWFSWVCLDSLTFKINYLMYLHLNDLTCETDVTFTSQRRCKIYMRKATGKHA